VCDLLPETACEVIESGICLTGGGACLPGMAARIAAETLVEVRPGFNPQHAVIRGAQEMLAFGMTHDLWGNLTHQQYAPVELRTAYLSLDFWVP
jgi:rod shape-determining protein MreB